MKIKDIKLASAYAEKAKQKIDSFLRSDLSNIEPAHLPIILSWITGKTAGFCANKLSIIKKSNETITIEELLTKFYQNI